MKRTSVIKKNDIKRKWFLFDATGVRLGRLASEIAKYLIGKHKAHYASNMVCGDYVVVINSRNVDVFPKREERKLYRKHTGYPGGLKERTLKQVRENSPNELVLMAVKNMLPKNKLRQRFLKNLYVFEDENHNKKAQKPKLIEIQQNA